MDETVEQTARAPSRHPLQVLWRHRWHVLLGVVVGLAAGGLMYARRPAVYQSAAQVLVVKKRSDALPMAGGDPRLTVYEDYVSTHLILIRSPAVIQRAVRKRDLGSRKSFQGIDPVGAIRAGLVATRDNPKDAPPGGGGNNIINLSFSAADPGDTEAVLVAVIESYRDYLAEVYQNVSDDTLAQITKARDVLDRQLVEKEKKWKEFRKNAPLLPKGGDGTNTYKVMYDAMQKEEDILLRREAEIKKRLEAIEKGRGAEPPEVLLALANQSFDRNAPPPTTDYARELALHPLLIKEKDLLRFYGTDHPEVVGVRTQIEATKELYGKLDSITKKAGQAAGGTGADRLDARVQFLRQELKVIETALAALRVRMTDTEARARDLERYEDENKLLWDDVTRTQKILDATLQRLQQIDLVRDYGGYQAKEIAPPGPGGKTSPVLFQFVALGAMIGLALGVGGAFLLDFTDKSFHTPEEIRRRLGLPLVGHIPFMPPAAPAAGDAADLDPALAVVHRPGSPEAECYRGVRTALYFGTRGERHQVIQVTSPNMGDGKTTLITNLAASIAQSGRKVVLVDADLRRPRVHRAFGVPGKVGLSEVLAGVAGLADTVRPTVVPNLSLLPCGRRPPNPSELLTSARLEEILDDLRDAFDFVLVDTPPLLAVSDPCTVASRVDGLVLTIRISKNGRPAAERARDVLAGLPVKILGVVVNGVGRHGVMSGYGYDQYQYTQDYAAEYTGAEAAADDPPDRPHPVGGNGYLSANGVHAGRHPGEDLP